MISGQSQQGFCLSIPSTVFHDVNYCVMFSSLKFIIDQYVTRKSRFLGLIKEIHDYF